MPSYLDSPIRVQHIGSLLRPEALFKARAALEKDRTSVKEQDLHAIEDDAVKHVVKLQQEAGVKLITDGEMRRGQFFENIFEKLEGMTYVPDRPLSAFKPYIPHHEAMFTEDMTHAETFYCTGKIKRTKPFAVEEFKYIKSIVPPEQVKNIKITLCSPSWFHQRHGSDETYDLSVYSNDDEYFNDLGVAYRAEIKDLYDLGCRYIQIDDPTFCYFCHEKMIAGMEKVGVDHEALLDTYIRAVNVCTQGRPHDLTIGVHMCRGNYKGGVHFSEGGYGRISYKLFNTLDVDVFCLEYDNERSGDFTPLRNFPLNKIAVLGLVTTKSPKLESPEDLKARVYEAAEQMALGNPNRTKEQALKQLAISTQCGFASVWEGNPLTEEDEKKKLELLVQVSKEIWPESA